ncbi:MAG: VCBS repeat-containing protein [Pseudomonadota bacterium]
MSVRFVENGPHAVAFAGRDANGRPQLGLVRIADDGPAIRRIDLPEDAVAIDVGAAGASRRVLFVLTTEAVLRLDWFDGPLQVAARTTSVYRGRSLGSIGAELDFARDMNGDGVAELVIPDFDVLRVFEDSQVTELSLSMLRRGYGLDATYEPADLKLAPGVGTHRLHAIAGNTLLTFAQGQRQAVETELPLGLSDELLLQKFYNGDDDIDQADLTLREVSEFADVNGDRVPDIATLETVSTGVFDKSTVYRVHVGAVANGALRFDEAADLTLSSDGYQVGTEVTRLGDGRRVLVSSSIKVGIGAVIGALFSRAVTLRTELLSLDAGDADREPTRIKSRIRFDFDSGRAALPTIKFGDLDGDGVSDLLLKTRAQTFSWRAGDAQGRFDSKERDVEFAAPADGDNVVLADLNGDGRDEIVVYYGVADTPAGRIGVFASGPR